MLFPTLVSTAMLFASINAKPIKLSKTPTNLIVNGNFENNSTGWNFAFEDNTNVGTVPAAHGSVLRGIGRSSSSAAKLSITGGPTTLTNTMIYFDTWVPNIVSGANYKLSFYARTLSTAVQSCGLSIVSPLSFDSSSSNMQYDEDDLSWGIWDLPVAKSNSDQTWGKYEAKFRGQGGERFQWRLLCETVPVGEASVVFDDMELVQV